MGTRPTKVGARSDLIELQAEPDLWKPSTTARLRCSDREYTSHSALPVASIWSLPGGS